MKEYQLMMRHHSTGKYTECKVFTNVHEALKEAEKLNKKSKKLQIPFTFIVRHI